MMELPVWQNLVLWNYPFASSFSEAHSKCSAFFISNSAVAVDLGLGVSTLFLFFGLICFLEIPVKITHYASILSHYASIIFIAYYIIAALRKSLCSLLSEFVLVWLKEFARREKIRIFQYIQ